MNHRNWKVLAVLAVVAGLIGCEWFLFRGPSVTVNLASDKIDDLQFRLRSSGVNEITGLSVWSEANKEFLWAVSMGRSPQQTVAYGKTPEKGKQTFPKDGSAPRRIQPGERFVLEVSYQYDTFMAACVGETFFVFEVDGTGKMRLVRQSEFIPGPPMP